MTTFRSMTAEQAPAAKPAMTGLVMGRFVRKHAFDLWFAKTKVSLEGSLF